MTQHLILENNYGFPIEAKIEVSGSISDFISFKKYIYLDVGETKDLGFTAASNENSEEGDYSGKIRVILRKA